MMIVEGNAPLAASYAANIIAIYQTYRWNTYVDAHAKDPQVWHGPVDNATWQDGYLGRRRACRDKVLAGRRRFRPGGRRPAGGGPGVRGLASARRDRDRAIAACGQAASAQRIRKDRGEERRFRAGRRRFGGEASAAKGRGKKDPRQEGCGEEAPSCEARALKTEAGPRAVGVGEYETTRPQTRTQAVTSVRVSAAARLFRLSAFSAADTNTPPVASCGR